MSVRSVVITFLITCVYACSGGSPDEPDGRHVSGVILPARITEQIGGEVTLSAQGFEAGDLIHLSCDTAEFTIGVKSVTNSGVTFVVPEGMRSGRYSIGIVRGGVEQLLGAVLFSITVSFDIPDRDGMNIKGMVYCDGVGVAGVVVSDGYEVATTDATGIYYLASGKRHGYVFISVPGGYEVGRLGAQPRFWQSLEQPKEQCEQLNFELTKIDNTSHTMVVMGDMHLANRTDDRRQFASFLAEVNELAKGGGRVYGLALGDMTWDCYWYSNSYGLTEYVAEVRDLAMPVFTTIGNHDYDMNARGDWDTAAKYKQTLGPTYYSFNIGAVHYVVLDNVECTNDGTLDGRNYRNRVDVDQVEWLKRDLAGVDAGTPVVVASHIPLHYATGVVQILNGKELLACLSGRPQVHFLTAHTHNNYNVETAAIFEHNVGAVCATWWWTGKLVGNNVCTDGTPGGYALWMAEGKNLKWRYKATGRSAEHQFRTYDLNETHITGAKYVPDGSDASRQSFESALGDYTQKRSDNRVLVNVWNWDSGWTLEVTENGQPLTPTRVSRKDPLHLVSYNAPRWNTNNKPTFPTVNTGHMFEVQASAPGSTLEIVITDRFGNVYKESMKRPKNLNLNI